MTIHYFKFVYFYFFLKYWAWTGIRCQCLNSGPLKQEVSSFAGAETEKERATADDEEFARMMSRLDELEKEELAAESGNHSDDNNETTSDFEEISHQRPIDNNVQLLEVMLWINLLSFSL